MRICFITGTRADYGLIKPVLDLAKKSAGIELQIIATGAHLEKSFGSTFKEIEKDGFEINAKVPTIKNDSPVDEMGRELGGLAKALDRLRPDVLFITGDRYEMLAAASAALISLIPIAHLYGGDITEGAFDDAIRHAITKMANLHFVSNQESQQRVIQMGEQPKTVFNVGSPSLDKIKTLKKLSKRELEDKLKIKFKKFSLLITFHPETLAKHSVETQIREVISALETLDENHVLIITMPNSDPGNQVIRASWQAFAKGRKNVYLFESVGYELYFNLMNNVEIVFGNSSSGVHEAPSFKVATVNIGDRQQGRLMAKSVVNCKNSKQEIVKAVNSAKKLDLKNVINPYGSGNSAKKIIDIITSKPELLATTRKKFYDIK